jgi:hypothetical protein
MVSRLYNPYDRAVDEKELIAKFISQMREHHAADVDAIDLPPGMNDYVAERIEQGDVETLLFMLKLGYIMGLQTGVAASQDGQKSQGRTPWGPIQA